MFSSLFLMLKLILFLNKDVLRKIEVEDTIQLIIILNCFSFVRYKGISC